MNVICKATLLAALLVAAAGCSGGKEPKVQNTGGSLPPLKKIDPAGPGGKPAPAPE